MCPYWPEHDIERGVGVGERLGIPFGKVDIDGGQAGVVSRAFQKHR